MTLEQCVDEQLQFAIEIKIVFDDKNYLEQICSRLLNKCITGYSITENKTSYSWNSKVEHKTNYVASTIIAQENLRIVVNYLNQEIKKKWQTPLIHVCPCFVNSSFYSYIEQNK